LSVFLTKEMSQNRIDIKLQLRTMMTEKTSTTSKSKVNIDKISFSYLISL